jgi:hypothetical protein
MRPFMIHDVAWLAGFLEGEGSFEWRTDRRPGRGRFGWPVVAVSTSDEDVIRRAADLMSVRAVTKYHVNGNHLGKKQMYKAVAYGGHAEDIMRIILPYMGERRAGRIREILAIYDSRPERRKRRKTCEILFCLLSQQPYSAVLQ